VHVEQARIATVQADQDLARMLGIGDQVLGSDPLERRQVAGVPACEVDGV